MPCSLPSVVEAGIAMGLIKNLNSALILFHALRAHDLIVNGPPPLIQGQRTGEMSESRQFQNFRIWVAVGVALVYVVLAVSGNA
jgi:hypothetical protein